VYGFFPDRTAPETAVSGVIRQDQFRYRRFETTEFKTSNLNFKKWKIYKKFLKILQVATNLIVSNFFKYSFI